MVLSLLMCSLAACGMECYALQGSTGFSTGDQILDNCGNICRAGHSFLVFCGFTPNAWSSLSFSARLFWSGNQEGKGQMNETAFVGQNSVPGVRTRSEGDEAQKPLFRNASRPGHSCSSILVKGVLREILFFI